MSRRRTLLTASGGLMDRSGRYLTILALEDGLQAKLSGNTVLYSLDKGNTWTSLPSNTYTPAVNIGQTIMFKGNLTPNSFKGIGRFTISKKCNLEGNCMSLLFGDDAANNNSLSGKDYAFCYLFSGCTTIIQVSDTFLPAATLASHCYYEMFYGCTSLTTAPELPATTLVSSCYDSMFYNCRSLNYIKMLATDIPESACLHYWVYNVSSTGTFIKNTNMSDLSGGVSGIPSNWTLLNDSNFFTIKDYTTTAVYGPFSFVKEMTWEQFINSEYNINNDFSINRINNTTVKYLDRNLQIPGAMIYINDVVKPTEYSLSSDSGGSGGS